MSQVEFPYPGMQAWKNPHGFKILRLHYEADPTKGSGEKVFVPELNLSLSPWALKEYENMTDKSLYRQEYEIDFAARLGQLVFRLDEESTLEPSFPIPPSWTRRVSLDPHPQVPHAWLWCATDPWGDRWYFRELWPSKVCYRYEGGRLMGSPGPCPEDDNRYSIKEYVQTIKWLESAENPENVDDKGVAFDEKIFERVIDYTARAFGKGTNDDPEQENFQQRYEHHMGGTCRCEPRCQRLSHPTFADAKKDHDTGVEVVNGGLRPIEVMGSNGEYRKRSKIHIFADKCPELIYQLRNNRWAQLSPLEQTRIDPKGMPIMVRKHQTDNLRYIEMSNPIYIAPRRDVDTSAPMREGFSY